MVARFLQFDLKFAALNVQTNKAAMQKPLDQIRNSAHQKAVRVGLAAAPAQSAQGSTIFYPWISAHAAAKRAWPFVVRSEAAGAEVGKAQPRTEVAAAFEVPPVGNTGGTIGSAKHG